MKRGMLMGIVLLATTLPAFAGHGTIRETDEAIIVEYTGDADDKADVKPVTVAAPLEQPPNPAVSNMASTAPSNSVPPAAESSRHVEQDTNAEAERGTTVLGANPENKGDQLSPAASRAARRAARNADIARRNAEQ